MFKRVDMKEAKEIISSNKYLLIDVREKSEYDEQHIKGAINIPLSVIDKEFVEKTFTNKAEGLLIYCRSGVRSNRVAIFLENLGYINVVDMGGILDWDGETEK